MLRKSLLLGSAVALTLGATVASADHGRDRRYDNDVEYARVVDVDPIVRRVRVTTPRRECWDEVRYEDRYERRRGGSAAGGMIVGGVVGGVLGSTIGRGDGRRVATAAGALIGAAIGHDVGKRAGERDRYYGGEERVVERCEIREEESWEERVDGYDVTYEYGGRRYRTRMPYDPGDRLPVEVKVRPA